MSGDMSMDERTATLRRAAKKLAKCSQGWEQMGYGSSLIYTCLDREIDIANPEHPTTGWWPREGPCDGCELARALGHKGKGTLTPDERRAERREQNDRQEFARLSAKYASTPTDGNPEET